MEKYKLVSEWIGSDGETNIVYIKRIYAVPWYKKKSKVVEHFHTLENYEIIKDGVRKGYRFIGWADDKCRTVEMWIIVTPNNGQIKYN
jgi:hypothetical protein